MPSLTFKLRIERNKLTNAERAKTQVDMKNKILIPVFCPNEVNDFTASTPTKVKEINRRQTPNNGITLGHKYANILYFLRNLLYK